ncbi:unnamed protein product [Ambrosiozyma monospora]|uniref:Unnamed protein product n=1 Tax=Ambrosiozyma monospora TaxID=43982 RepID=A0A9W7DJ71_AMBMO|nr:unnamed protein product [Ambrosiozyma monospora]
MLRSVWVSRWLSITFTSTFTRVMIDVGWMFMTRTMRWTLCNSIENRFFGFIPRAAAANNDDNNNAANHYQNQLKVVSCLHERSTSTHVWNNHRSRFNSKS